LATRFLPDCFSISDGLCQCAIQHFENYRNRHDVNGSAIEGATVTVTNEATGVAFTQVTTSDGVYAFTR
jgi:hypothetical protein